MQYMINWYKENFKNHLTNKLQDFQRFPPIFAPIAIFHSQNNSQMIMNFSMLALNFMKFPEQTCNIFYEIWWNSIIPCEEAGYNLPLGVWNNFTHNRPESWHNYHCFLILVAVFKRSAGLRTLNHKTGVSPAHFPSLPYINFGKILLQSSIFQILFWRLLWWWNQNILGKLGQYRGYQCPGSLCRQDISSHSIEYTG